MNDLRKYLIRFGLVLLIVSPILLLTQGASAFRIVAYKICLVMIGVGLAELIWAFFYKPVYGKSEEMADNARQAIMLFRGILYSAVILALTLGL